MPKIQPKTPIILIAKNMISKTIENSISKPKNVFISNIIQ